ncbi:MAG TPA: hypothetical protein VFC99_01660 [Acidimicrobiia bacterium]|nr:hypothetical protein [Acidimicrobiia bacterium]
MNPTRSGTALGRPAPPEAATPAGRERAGGVEGNARLTGIVAAALFVVLGAEGVTLLGIRQLISVHVFVGMLLVPLVVLKTASTCYRTARYYSGDARYRQKGPPHPILRVTGPFLVLTSLALLGSGIALVALGRRVGHGYLWVHKTVFFVWGALIAVHVLGHLRETVTLASADWRARPPVAGVRGRVALLGAALAVGVALAVVSLGWVGSWGDVAEFGHHFG